MLAPLARLIDFIFPPRDTELLVREVSIELLRTRLSPVLVGTTHPETTALLSWGDPVVRALIHEAKYRASTHAQELLAALLADYLSEISADAWGRVALVPLPLSRARAKERGFNQTEVIARRALARAACAPIILAPHVLTRTKDTEHQARLSRAERLRNVKGAFAASMIDPTLTYLLFDDVVTTGATMQEAIRALRSAGARHVIPLTLAR